MTTHASQSEAAEWKRGWPVVIAAMSGFLLSAVFTFSIGAFIAPIEREFGWSRAEISLGVTVITITGALLTPPIGILVDRVGPRRLGVPGALVFAISYGILGLTTSDVRVWWALWFLLAFAFIFIKPLIWTTAVASTFDKGRGLALALALCGNGLASTFAPALATWAIATWGWRLAFPIIGLGLGLAAFPILYFFLHSGADDALGKRRKDAAPPRRLSGVSAREAFVSLTFVKLASAAFLFTIAAIGIVPNMIPILTSFGIGRMHAAQIAGAAGVASIGGRLVTGYLLDRINPSLVGGLIVLLPVASCLMLLGAPGSVPVAIAAALIFGLALGSEVDVIAFLTARQFGTLRYGTVFGIISALWAIATGIGPTMVNRIYDVTDSYVLALQGAIPLFAITALMLFTLGKPLRFEEADAS